MNWALILEQEEMISDLERIASYVYQTVYIGEI